MITIGKLYPHGVAFKEYDFTEENFRGPNYVAVHSARDDLVEMLRYSRLARE